VSQYQKGKTNLDFTEARDSEWHQLGHMQVCTSLQTDNHASAPPLSFYRPDALPAAQPTASKHCIYVLMCLNISPRLPTNFSIICGILRAAAGCCVGDAGRLVELKAEKQLSAQLKQAIVDIRFHPRSIRCCFQLSQFNCTARNVRRILDRGGQCPLAACGEENYENLTTKWCILKYI